MSNFIKSRIKMPISLLKIIQFLLILLLVLGILFIFKILFFTSCLSVGNVTQCTASGVDSSSTLFAIGGILIAIVSIVPTFWIESKIKDAKKEVSREVLEDIQGKIQNLSKAQMLVSEAEKYTTPAVLLIRESLVQQAINLWPPFRLEESRKLGDAYSNAVMEVLYHAPDALRENILLYTNRAISYLEETVLRSENPDRAGLVDLACMYGVSGKYEAMIHTIERVIKVDENARDDFQEARRLTLLIRACGRDRKKIEKLSKKIGKEVPLSKHEFIQIIREMGGQISNGDTGFFMVTRSSTGPKPICIARLSSWSNGDDKLEIGGQIFEEFEGKNPLQDIPARNNQPPAYWHIPVEEFFDEVNKQFFVICYKDQWN